MQSEYLYILIWVGPFFFLFIILEFLITNYHHLKIYKWKDLMASGTFGIGTILLTPLIKAFITTSLFYLAYDMFNPINDGIRQNILGYSSFGWEWYIWIFCMLIDDFVYYWFHRLNHTVRVLWAAHIVHHSSQHFNFGTGVRNGWFTLFYKPLFYMWIAALGFRPEMVLICMGIESLWQFQLHTQFISKLGIFDKFINSHTMHQVHHAKNVEYLDKNHGGILNLFDRLFGTWKEFDHEIAIEYGVVHDPKSYNPWDILMHEYKCMFNDVKRSKNIYQAMMYIFGEPGWSPDKSTLTVKEQQRLLLNS
ncbi:MAG: sterol desaturase family protein [Flavobacteriaceae bacterium]|nr:sterol desaturase family protein [Flavobacteriaceae bacterium]